MTGLSVYRLFLVSALVCATGACGGDKESSSEYDPEAANREERLAVLDKEAEESAANARERSAIEARDPAPTVVLEFDRLEISPAEASVKTDEFNVQAFLKPGASAFTEVTFKWTVDERELVGYSIGKLRKNEGRWKALDWITVQAFAVDDQGRQAESAPVAVQIANGSPQIITDLTNTRYLNGTRMEATDPDDDPITWSLEGDPPGVSISADGLIKVRDVQLDKDFVGEAVFVAEDPHGARNELHLPLTINAAVAGRTEDAGVDVREAEVRELTDDELMRQAEEDAKLVESLSEAELKKLLEEREAARKQ